MKKLLPLLATAALLAGCADDSSNPWSTEQERADSRVNNAAQVAPDPVVGAPSAEAPKVPENKYSWQKKTEEPKPEPKIEISESKVVVVAIRGDAGLIQIRRTGTSNVGDKLVLTKDGKSLQVVVHSVEGQFIIADITARQINTPTILVGDIVDCAPLEAPKPADAK